MNTPMNPDPAARLAALAARLLGLAMRNALDGSAPAEVARAAGLHDAGKLYPRLVITAPHGGGAVRLELTLHDPETDDAVVRMFEGEAAAEDMAWAH